MGDDNEIRKLIRRESETFLDRALRESQDLGQTYDFEHEFGKTKRNRSPVVYLVTGLTILALSVAAIVTTNIIRERTRSMPVDVRAFEDVNLKELLDTAKRNESERERITVDLSNLEEELSSGLEAADRDLRANLEAIAALGLPAEAQLVREREARASADAKKRELRNRLEPQIKNKKAQLAEVQKKIDQYDQKLTEQAKRQQEILQNERRLFDEEKRRLIASYETRISELEAARKRDAAEMKRQREELTASLTARWNPIFSTTRDTELLGGKPPKVADPVALPEYLRRESILTPELEARLRRTYENYQYLSGRLRAVPYLNSVPPALARMEAEVKDSIAGYRTVLEGSSRGLQDRERTIGDRDKTIAALTGRAEAAERALERYSWAVSEFVRQNTEGGYILDPRDPENVVIALNPAVPAVDGTLGYVFRTSDRYIGTLAFSIKDGKTRARILELAPSERLLPLDPILIRVEAPSRPAPAPAAPAPAPTPVMPAPAATQPAATTPTPGTPATTVPPTTVPAATPPAATVPVAPVPATPETPAPAEQPTTTPPSDSTTNPGGSS